MKSKALGNTGPTQRSVFDRTQRSHAADQGQVGAADQKLEAASSPELSRAGWCNNGAANKGSHLAYVLIFHYFFLE